MRTWPGGGPRENFGQIMVHTLSLGTVLLTSSPPLFMQCRSGCSADLTGRRSARELWPNHDAYAVFFSARCS